MKLRNKSTYSANVRRGFTLALFIATPLFCAAETWTDAALVDANCAAKVQSNPDAHTKDCALKCSKSGYGILTADGTFLKFDSQGNEQATTALKGYQTADHLRATVTGERDGGTIKVKSLKM